MAFSVTTTASTMNATPKVGQPFLLKVTVANPGTTAFSINGVGAFPVTPPSSAFTLGKVTHAYTTTTGGTVIGAMSDVMVAGSGPRGYPITLAAGETAVFNVQGVLHVAGAQTFEAEVCGLNATTKATVSVPGTSPVTVTAS